MADKKKKLKRQVSNDGGRTWQDMIPYEYMAGELIQRDSPDCNNVEWRTVSGYICEENTTEITQWVADTGYVCVGFDKYNKEKEQVSYNSGISWADTGNTRAGSTLIEANSTDCGYIPAIKATLTYQNGDTYNILENGSSMLTDSEVRRDISDTSDVHHYTKITSAVVYDTVDALGGSFEQCTNLASITLPSTPLEIYGNTFIYCESLGNITLGNNITLDDGGSNIFGHCTSLTNITIPSNIKKLPYGFLSFCENLKTVTIEATDFDMFSDNVFFNCSSLESITLKATTPPTFGYQMLYNVPANVNIYVPCASLNAYKTASGWSNYADRIQCESDYSRVYLTTEALGSGNIKLNGLGGVDNKIPLANIQYSKNNDAWSSYTYGTNISVVTGDKIRWKATLNDGNSIRYYSYFGATADYKAYGNPLSLLNNDSFINEPDAIYKYAYYGLFYNNSKLKDISGLTLPATTLAEWCYCEMFLGCTSLTSIPSNFLPATTLVERCYMQMFDNCTSLNSVTCCATNKSAYDCTYLWLRGVSSTGTFTKASGVTWSSGSSGIPSGWTIVDAT